jgi:hypothetical protein
MAEVLTVITKQAVNVATAKVLYHKSPEAES